MPLGEAAVVRPGDDVTIVALASTVPTALSAAEQLAGEDISVEVIDLRCLVPLDAKTVLSSVRAPRACCWSKKPLPGRLGRHGRLDRRRRGIRITRRADPASGAECVPLPFADALEDEVIPTVDKVVDAVRRLAAF